MKRILLGLLLMVSMTSFGQVLTDGSYWSNVTVYQNNEKKVYGFEFTVSNGIVKQKNVPAVSVTKNLRDITTYTWLNQGGIWTESQTFVFSKEIESGKVMLYYLRVVQNEGQDSWIMCGYGEVYRD